MDHFRISLSLLALAVCLAYVGWLVICLLPGRKQSTASVLIDVLLSCLVLVAGGLNCFAGATFPVPSLVDLGILLAVSMSLAVRFGLRTIGPRSRVVVAHAILVSAAAWNLHCSTRQDSVDLGFSGHVEKVLVDDAVIVTDQGRIFSVFRFDTGDQIYEDGVQNVFADKIVRVASEDLQTNCHGWVFAKGRYGLPAQAVAALLQDNGYSAVSSPRSGDVIVYRDEAGTILHSGRVRSVHENGQVWIESKWGPGGRYVHRPEDQCYSSTFSYYRSARPTHEAQIVQTPVTKDVRVARSEGLPTRPARG